MKLGKFPLAFPLFKLGSVHVGDLVCTLSAVYTVLDTVLDTHAFYWVLRTLEFDDIYIYIYI